MRAIRYFVIVLTVLVVAFIAWIGLRWAFFMVRAHWAVGLLSLYLCAAVLSGVGSVVRWYRMNHASPDNVGELWVNVALRAGVVDRLNRIRFKVALICVGICGGLG